VHVQKTTPATLAPTYITLSSPKLRSELTPGNRPVRLYAEWAILHREPPLLHTSRLSTLFTPSIFSRLRLAEVVVGCLRGIRMLHGSDNDHGLLRFEQ
jgi:hypothetical protein